MNDETEPEGVTDLRQLISEVHQANGHVSTLSREVKKLRGSNEELKASNARLVTSRRRHRLALILGTIGLLVAFFAVGVALRGLNRQSCVNTRSQHFFAAEQAKVSGQVAGLRELRNSNGDRAKALEGFNKFIDASQHYLDTIGSIRERCR